MPTQSPLLVIVGPTAVGKTRLSLTLAQALNGEIISADSRYLYRGMDIGTDKPSPAERAAIPHHLIDVTNPGQTWALPEYQAAAQAAIAEITARGKLPLLVGGTGQYIRALLEGWVIPPLPEDPTLRDQLAARLAAEGYERLWIELQQLDPAVTAWLDPRNTRRLLRALEVCLATGQPFSSLRRKEAPAFKPYVLGLTLPRPVLHARVATRIDRMLANGLVAEIAGLLAKGYHWELPAFSALGYRQMQPYFAGTTDLATVAATINVETHRFIRRQANWFSTNDPTIHWYNSENFPLADWLQNWQSQHPSALHQPTLKA
jgi:tRNA dimethylallyltransferase